MYPEYFLANASFFPLITEYTALLKCPKPTNTLLSAWLKENITVLLNN